jgi:hypothetical protein
MKVDQALFEQEDRKVESFTSPLKQAFASAAAGTVTTTAAALAGSAAVVASARGGR